MFLKLLKHDSRAVFKYWWLGAVASLLIAVVGGFCMKIAIVDYTKYDVLPVIGGIGVVVCRLGVYLFPVFSQILIIYRYYKHFFTDEGYLTFTLPVRKTSLLDSKIAVSFIFSLASSVITYLNLFIILAIGEPEIIGTVESYSQMSVIFSLMATAMFGYDFVFDFIATTGSYAVPYLVIALLIGLVFIIVQTLFYYACITLASSIVKKHKILLAVGLYYGASSVIAGAFWSIVLFGVFTSYDSYANVAQADMLLACLFVLIGVLGVLLMVAGGLYLLLTYLLDKKLNLE